MHRVFTYEFRIPWVDTDAAGVVHFSNYFRYCEKVEEEFLNSIGLSYDRQGGDDDVWYPRINASCSYKWPLRFNQTAKIELYIKEFGNKHVTYYFKIHNVNENKIAAECTIVVVSASKSKGKSVSLPEVFKEKIKSLIKERE